MRGPPVRALDCTSRYEDFKVVHVLQEDMRMGMVVSTQALVHKGVTTPRRERVMDRHYHIWSLSRTCTAWFFTKGWKITDTTRATPANQFDHRYEAERLVAQREAISHMAEYPSE